MQNSFIVYGQSVWVVIKNIEARTAGAYGVNIYYYQS